MPDLALLQFAEFFPDLVQWSGFILTAGAIITPEGDTITPAELRHYRWLRNLWAAEARRARRQAPEGVTLTLAEYQKLREIVELLGEKLNPIGQNQRSGRRRP